MWLSESWEALAKSNTGKLKEVLSVKAVCATLRNFLSEKFEQKWQGMESNRNEGKVVAFIGKSA